MGGPWEKYQQQSSTDGPWTKYQTPAPKSGIPEAGPSRAGMDFSAMGDMAADFSAKGALPTAGSLALPAAGTALLGPANLPFVPLERGLGSMMGEGANQLLGITEPSMTQLVAAFAVPAGTEYAVNTLRTMKGLPGALNREAPAMAKSQMGGYRGAVPASQVMEEATQEGLTIPLSSTTAALQEIRNIMGDKTPAGMRAFEKVLKDTGLEDLATSPGGGITPSKMQGLLEDIGALKASAEDGIEKKYLGKFFSALNDDLDNAGAKLGPARDYWKREQVLNDIEGRINAAVFTPKGQGLNTQFSAQKIINELNDTSEGLGKWFSQSFSKKEQGEIKSLFGFLNEIPSLQPGAGVNSGSLRFWERATKAGAGAGIGYSVAGPMGAGVGLLANEAIDAGSLVMKAWKMPGGKQFVKNMFMNADGALTPGALSSLSAFVTGGAGSKVSESAVHYGSMLMPFGNEQ